MTASNVKAFKEVTLYRIPEFVTNTSIWDQTPV